MEAFDNGVNFFNEKLKKSGKHLSCERNLNEAKAFNEAKKTTSADVYEYFAANGSLKQLPNIVTLFETSLLIPPILLNIERGFSVMNLICTPLRTESKLDRFIRICINGPETYSKCDIEKMVDIFKKTNDNRRLDL